MLSVVHQPTRPAARDKTSTLHHATPRSRTIPVGRAAGRSPQYTPQPFSYQDFVSWEQRHLQSDAAEGISQYWIKHIEGAPQTMEDALKAAQEAMAAGAKPGGTWELKLKRMMVAEEENNIKVNEKDLSI